MRYALRVIMSDVCVFALSSFLLSLSLHRRHYEVAKISSLFFFVVFVGSRAL